MPAALRQVREALAARRPVLVSGGDPLFYGVARYLCDRLGKDQFEVVPHVSSMQLAFARVKESWEDAYLTNLAGRPARGGRRPDPDGREGRPVLQRRAPAVAARAGAARPRDRLLPGLRLREPRLARRAGHAGRARRPGRAGLRPAQRHDPGPQAEPARPGEPVEPLPALRQPRRRLRAEPAQAGPDHPGRGPLDRPGAARHPADERRLGHRRRLGLGGDRGGAARAPGDRSTRSSPSRPTSR